TFEAIAPDRKPFLGSVTVTEGQAARFEVPVLAPATTAATDRNASLPGPAAAPFVEPPRADEGAGNTWQRPLAIGLAAVGGAGLAVGGAASLGAKSAKEQPFDTGQCGR